MVGLKGGAGYRPQSVPLQQTANARRRWRTFDRTAINHVHAATAMCRRHVSKFQKTVLIVLFYFTVYVLVSYSMSPETSYSFVSDDLRVGDKYALIFLVAPRTPVFSDSEGADVFKSRRCGQCFITNNRGFLPMSEYDAILVLGDRGLLYEPSAFMDPGKRFLIETSKKCVHDKLRGCSWEPRVTSFGGNKPYDLCSLCDHLHRKRLKPYS